VIAFAVMSPPVNCKVTVGCRFSFCRRGRLIIATFGCFRRLIVASNMLLGHWAVVTVTSVTTGSSFISKLLSPSLVAVLFPPRRWSCVWPPVDCCLYSYWCSCCRHLLSLSPSPPVELWRSCVEQLIEPCWAVNSSWELLMPLPLMCDAIVRFHCAQFRFRGSHCARFHFCSPHCVQSIVKASLSQLPLCAAVTLHSRCLHFAARYRQLIVINCRLSSLSLISRLSSLSLILHLYRCIIILR